MGYRITYGKRKRDWRSIMRYPVLVAAFFLLFLHCVRLRYPEIVGLLLPEVLEELVQQVFAGESVGDAVAAFCQDVVHGN